MPTYVMSRGRQPPVGLAHCVGCALLRNPEPFWRSCSQAPYVSNEPGASAPGGVCNLLLAGVLRFATQNAMREVFTMAY